MSNSENNESIRSIGAEMMKCHNETMSPTFCPQSTFIFWYQPSTAQFPSVYLFNPLHRNIGMHILHTAL